MRSLLLAAALGASTLVITQAAFAFTYEGQGSGQQPSSAQGAPKAGLDMDPGSLMPPIGTSVPGATYDFGPGAFNNGLASPPTRSDSVGPSWLYPPR